MQPLLESLRMALERIGSQNHPVSLFRWQGASVAILMALAVILGLFGQSAAIYCGALGVFGVVWLLCEPRNEYRQEQES